MAATCTSALARMANTSLAGDLAGHLKETTLEMSLATEGNHCVVCGAGEPDEGLTEGEANASSHH
jgi:hypothetical protein